MGDATDSDVERIESDAEDRGEGERLKEGTEKPEADEQGSGQQSQQEQHANARVRLCHG
jgi:hypothetical protein